MKIALSVRLLQLAAGRGSRPAVALESADRDTRAAAP